MNHKDQHSHDVNNERNPHEKLNLEENQDVKSDTSGDELNNEVQHSHDEKCGDTTVEYLPDLVAENSKVDGDQTHLNGESQEMNHDEKLDKKHQAETHIDRDLDTTHEYSEGLNHGDNHMLEHTNGQNQELNHDEEREEIEQNDTHETNGQSQQISHEEKLEEKYEAETKLDSDLDTKKENKFEVKSQIKEEKNPLPQQTQIKKEIKKRNS